MLDESFPLKVRRKWITTNYNSTEQEKEQDEREIQEKHHRTQHEGYVDGSTDGRLYMDSCTWIGIRLQERGWYFFLWTPFLFFRCFRLWIMTWKMNLKPVVERSSFISSLISPLLFLLPLMTECFTHTHQGRRLILSCIIFDATLTH